MGRLSLFALSWLLLFSPAPGIMMRGLADEPDLSLTPMVTDLNQLATPGRYRATIKSEEYKRTFICVTPKGLKPGHPLPLVFFFHGAGGTAQQAFSTYGWAEKAEKEHFFVVFPEGLGAQPKKPGSFTGNPNIWRDGRTDLPGQEVNDIRFFEDLLIKLQLCLPVDAQRVYVTGFSNGGGMAFTVGAHFADRIAAIAPVGSQSFVQVNALPRPLPLYYLVGSADPLVPYRGGHVTLPWGGTMDAAPIQESVEQWVRLDGCPPQPQALTDAHGVLTVSYGREREHPEIVFTTVEGNGHHWPGAAEPLPAALSGPCRDPFNATNAIWDFFKKHPMKGD